MTRIRSLTAADRYEFTFVSKLAQVERGGYFAVDVPAKISKVIGKRGPVPVSARINDIASFTASLSPSGGGRHRLRLNARIRALAEAHTGDLVRVHVRVHHEPLKVVVPEDIKRALQAEGVFESFQAFAPGKQNHIIDWINRSARPETREKRIHLTVEITHQHLEKRRNREARTAARGAETPSL